MKIVCSYRSGSELIRPWLIENNFEYIEDYLVEITISYTDKSDKLLKTMKIPFSGNIFEISEDDFAFFLLTFGPNGEYFNSNEYYSWDI